MQRCRIQFTGRVQGVGFRATARSLAGGRALTGWVRNEPDGSVVTEVQGEAPEIDRFLAELRGRFGRSIRAESVESLPVHAGESVFEVRQ